jgi:hypothetical protein
LSHGGAIEGNVDRPFVVDGVALEHPAVDRAGGDQRVHRILLVSVDQRARLEREPQLGNVTGLVESATRELFYALHPVHQRLLVDEQRFRRTLPGSVGLQEVLE